MKTINASFPNKKETIQITILFFTKEIKESKDLTPLVVKNGIRYQLKNYLI
jgi:hypothetical protein